MNSEQKKTTTQAFCGVLEKMAFLFAEPVGVEDVSPCEQPCTLVSMTFSGVMRGTVELALPDPLGAEIAANILGNDSGTELSQQHIEDATKELLNVACGQILTDLAGERPMFDLSVPEARTIGENDRKRLLAHKDTLVFSIDGDLIALRVSLERSA